MLKHASAIVPIETWCFNSPDVAVAGQAVDLGLFAEALLYYDAVLVHVSTPGQFATLLKWVQSSGHFEDFVRLVQEGAIFMYDYSFLTVPAQKDGVWALLNAQDPVQAAYGTFPRRFLYHEEVERAVPSSRRRKRLYEALRDHVIEAKADDFGPAIRNAQADYSDARRSRIIVQAFVDEVYRYRKLGRPPEVQAVVTPQSDGERINVTWNVDFAQLNKLAGSSLGFAVHSPLSAAGVSNRLLWSAASRNCDLFLGRPMAHLVGDKLFESVGSAARAGEIIQNLKGAVQFPDVRALTNEGTLHFGDVLSIREKARRFRGWLQEESDRDRDALIAYHNEVAVESGLASAGRKTIAVFGVLAGGAVGGALGATFAGPEGGAVAGAAGAGLTYLTDIGAKIGAGWRPIVFGQWLESRIAQYLDGADAKVKRPNA